MARSFVLTGAKLGIYVNGRRYALAMDFSWESDSPKKALHVVDQLEAFELTPGPVRVSGTMNVIRQSGDGGAEGAGIVAPLKDISKERYFSLTVIELDTDITIFSAQRCSLVRQAWQVGARGLLRGTLTWEAIEFINEASQ